MSDYTSMCVLVRHSTPYQNNMCTYAVAPFSLKQRCWYAINIDII